MTLLSARVQKSKSLTFNRVLHYPSIVYGTTSHAGMHHYQIALKKVRETSLFLGTQHIEHDTINVTCIKCFQPVDDCPGNSHHTICYHALGAIRHHLGFKGYSIAFCDDIRSAFKLQKSGETIVKVVSTQGEGVLWGVVAEKPKDIAQKLAENTLHMRLSAEESEGID